MWIPCCRSRRATGCPVDLCRTPRRHCPRAAIPVYLRHRIQSCETSLDSPRCCARRATNHDHCAKQHQVCLLTPETLLLSVYDCCSRRNLCSCAALSGPLALFTRLDLCSEENSWTLNLGLCMLESDGENGGRRI